jgi:hypothetical protein
MSDMGGLLQRELDAVCCRRFNRHRRAVLEQHRALRRDPRLETDAGACVQLGRVVDDLERDGYLAGGRDDLFCDDLAGDRVLNQFDELHRQLRVFRQRDALAIGDGAADACLGG